MTTTTEEHHLTLSDIALLARVKRPVVSTWRARSASGPHPFPSPATHKGHQELFAVEEIVSWLQATGLGNNPDAVDDAVGFTVTSAQAVDDEVAFAGLTALLCLYVINSSLPTGDTEILDLADECDADDLLLYREIEALGDGIEGAARYARLLAESSFDPAVPFEDVLDRRARAQGRPGSNLSADLRSLTAEAAHALADQAGFVAPVFVVTTASDVDLLFELALPESRGALSVAIRGGNEPDLRLARRRLRVHDMVHVDLIPDGHGGFDLPAESVVLMRVPGSLGQPDVEVLDEISNLTLDLTEDHRVIVVGASALLTDALLSPTRRRGRPSTLNPDVGEATAARRDVVKTDLLRAIVRLPPGGLLAAPRSRAAVWCLGPNPPTPRQAHTYVGDVTSRLTPTRRRDLLVDLVASMSGPMSGRAHLMQFGRLVPSSELQMNAGNLVTPQSPLGGRVQSVEVMEDVRRSLEFLREPVPGLAAPRVDATEHAGWPGRTTLGEAVRRGGLRRIPGVRLDPEHLSEGGGIPVLSHARELAQPSAAPTIDRLVHVTHYAHSQLTQPGDIVISTSPSPQARVDHEGGLMVAYPAFILRCHRPSVMPTPSDAETPPEPVEGHRKSAAPQTFVPEAVAADINALQDDVGSWPSWPLHLSPVDEVEDLEQVLNSLARQRDWAERRLLELDQLTGALIRGVSSRTFTISPAEGT